MVYIPVSRGGGVAPALSRPSRGSQPSLPKKISCSSSPLQKTGIPTPTTERKRTKEFAQLRRPEPVMTPNGMPTKTVIVIAISISSKVAGRNLAMSSITGLRDSIEVPRSPCASRPR